MPRLSQLPIPLLASLFAATWLPGLLPLSVGASPTVKVALKAAFPSPPYLVELLETAALDNATRYYALLDDIAKGRFASATTDRDLYSLFLDTLQQHGHMDAEALSTFKLALSMRSAAPRIEAQYHFYATTVEPSLPDDQAACADCWVLLDGKQYCSPELLDSAGRELKAANSSHAQERILPYDRVLHAPGTREAILYADITSPAFTAFHEAARGLASQQEASYRVRYRKTAGHVEQLLPVNGYGVELGLKRTDYIVIDDRAGSDAQENNEGETKAEGKAGLDGNTPGHEQVVVLDEEEEIADIKPLEKSELAPLAMKAASFVMQSDSPLDTLLKLTQDFPRYSTKLGGHNVSAEFQAEYEENRQIGLVPAGANVLWMNGVQLIDRQIQPFGLVDLLQRERKLFQGVLDLGLTGEQAVSLLGHDEVARARAGADEVPRFDWRDDIEVGIEEPKPDNEKANEDVDERAQEEQVVEEGHEGQVVEEEHETETKPETRRPQVIIWLNNLEKDKRYDGYSTRVWALLQAAGGQGLPRVRKEIFNLVLPVDLSKPEDLHLVLVQLLKFMKQGIPVRFGFVPLMPTAEAAEQAKVVYYLQENYGLAGMVSYLDHSLEEAGGDDKAAWKTVGASQSGFEGAIKDRELRAGVPEALSFQHVLDSVETDEHVQRARHWAARLHADAADGHPPPAFFNGLVFPRNDNWLRAFNQKLISELRMVQQSVYFGQITDDTNVPAFLLQNAWPRRNTLLHPDDEGTAAGGEQVALLNVHKMYAENKQLLDSVLVVKHGEDSTRDDWALLTLVMDMNTAKGRALFLSALEFGRGHPGVRMDMVHSPANPATRPASRLNKKMQSQKEKLLSAEQMSDLESLLGEEGQDTDADADTEAPEPSHDAALHDFLASINARPGEGMVVLNGRAIGPIKPTDTFIRDDFEYLLQFERAIRILPVYRALADLGLDDKISGPLAAAALTSVTALSGVSDLPQGIFDSSGPSIRTTAYKAWNAQHTAFTAGEDPSKASIFLAAAINPLSETGQKWTAVLKVLSELTGVHLQVFLNPTAELAELPVKRFYRYVLESEPRFDPTTGRVQPLSATFSGVPIDTLLVTGMDVPPAWLVSPLEAVEDLDNLRLKDVMARRGSASASDVTVEAVYALDHILIEGHSRDVPSGAAPRGAQLVLETAGAVEVAGNDTSAASSSSSPLPSSLSASFVADTIIMANLGYFQFRANPGVYRIGTAAGRSTDIFTIESVGASGWQPAPGDEGTGVVLMDFQGTTLYPRLRRRPGMEEQDVLADGTDADADADADPDDSLGGKARDLVSQGLKFAGDMFGGSGGGSKPTTSSLSASVHAEVNIFSVASGHLYERMLNIMMVSVMRHTKSTVKFWFIEQFLSPSFRAFIPQLAAEHGFRYEMVSYKWPHWLRGQREKQREIWGYKILFLDVLFPLSLDRVIFVDADQVVRADMAELARLELSPAGAPYAFTPMCDSRVEMEGFRFWKTGYWRTYLRGKPYYISALYVVDLRRFRALAAGDRLRQQYHALSADPASLSNLDQDLPNHMQHQIPIHTLPQDWLWCETWCSDAALATAKTIDLCNNPLTKEPKLDRARRQLPEWTVYDEEVAAVVRRWRAERGSGGGGVGGVGGDEDDGTAVGGATTQEQEQQHEKEEQQQKVMGGGDGGSAQPRREEQEEEGVERNPKSRRLDDEEAAAKASHARDEL